MWSWWRFDPHHFALTIGVVVQVLGDGNEIVKIVFQKRRKKITTNIGGVKYSKSTHKAKVEDVTKQRV